MMLDIYSRLLVCSVKSRNMVPKIYQSMLLLYYLMPNDILEHLLIQGLITHREVVFYNFSKNRLEQFMQDEFTDVFLSSGFENYFDEDTFIKLMNIPQVHLQSLLKVAK